MIKVYKISQIQIQQNNSNPRVTLSSQVKNITRGIHHELKYGFILHKPNQQSGGRVGK